MFIALWSPDCLGSIFKIILLAADINPPSGHIPLKKILKFNKLQQYPFTRFITVKRLILPMIWKSCLEGSFSNKHLWLFLFFFNMPFRKHEWERRSQQPCDTKSREGFCKVLSEQTAPGLVELISAPTQSTHRRVVGHLHYVTRQHTLAQRTRHMVVTWSSRLHLCIVSWQLAKHNVCKALEKCGVSCELL